MKKQAAGRKIALLVLLCIPCACGRQDVSIQEDGLVLIKPGTGVTAVEGPWEFYWDRILMPADFSASSLLPDAIVQEMHPWNGLIVDGKSLTHLGIATYRMRFVLDGVQGRAGIWFPHQLTSTRVYVDGLLKAEIGRIGKTAADSIPGRDSAVLFFDAPGRHELVFQIANASSFQGGMRGNMKIGSEEAVQRYSLQRLAIEILTFGLVAGAAIYHLSFFLLHRSQTAFLFFALVCFTLVLRLPLQGARFHTIFLDPLSWETTARLFAAINTWSIPLGIYFIRGLFPDFVPASQAALYLAVAAIASLMHVTAMPTLTLLNLLYTTIMLAVLVVHSAWVLWHAFQAQRSASFMALGMGALGLFSGISLIQNWRGQDGAIYGLASFSFFVFFQSLALSRYFQGVIEAEAGLTERLRESKQALTHQRQQLQVSLHDSLGGALTDLQVHTEQQMRAGTVSSAEALSAIHDRIIDTVKMFRSQLLFMEDLEMTAQELIPGLQMSLLRRYADAGREIDFEVSPEAARRIEEGGEDILPVDRVVDLFFLATELCTNDLKHGQGESFWRISLEGNHLTISQRNGMRSTARPIHTPHRASERIRRLSGTIHAEALGGEYCVEARIPLRGGRDD
jgi:hypothetical protein